MARNNRGTFLLPLVVMAKSTKIIAVLKSVQVLKVLLSLASMLLSVIVYGLTLGIWFGVGFVMMLFIHEMGHVIALRRKGLPSSLPVFIPFLGAAIFAPDMGDRSTEAYVGYAGPFVGSIAAIACFGLWAVLGGTSDLLLIISYIGVYINLFNLIPVSPLDGGRITQAVGGWFKYIGATLAVALVVMSAQAGMIFLLILMLDSFRFPLFARPCAAFCLWLAMLVLIACGYTQEFYVDIADMVIGCAFTLLYGWRDVSRARRELARAKEHTIRWFVNKLKLDDESGLIELPLARLPRELLTPLPRDFIGKMKYAQKQVREKDDLAVRLNDTIRELPAIPTRVRWFMAYIALAGVLGGTIILQNTLLPHHLQPPPERHSVG